MSFIEHIPDKQLVLQRWREATAEGVERLLGKTTLGPADLPVLVSEAADPHLESMAARAHQRTLMKFGRTIQLYVPLYLSNECTNGCVYCGFRAQNRFPRTTSSLQELEAQFRIIRDMEMRHILLLTGEAPLRVPVEYVGQCIALAKRYFPSVSLEVYPMSEADYRRVIEAGAEGLTLYQETYDREKYAQVHPNGPKRDFMTRLDAVECGARAGFRKIGIGALLGLDHPAFEMTAVGLHLDYLKRRYPEVFYTVSFPRLRRAEGEFEAPFPVGDRQLAKMIIAMRLVFDDIGLVVSTREPADLRDHMLPLGVTQISAGSRTEPGGYLNPDKALKQFEIEDHRDPRQVVEALLQRGYEPVFKDWERDFR